MTLSLVIHIAYGNISMSFDTLAIYPRYPFPRLLSSQTGHFVSERPYAPVGIGITTVSRSVQRFRRVACNV